MKKLLRKIVTSVFNLAGIDVAFARRKNSTSYQIIDTNVIEVLWKNDQCMERYFKGLNIAGVQETDNFFKQGRHYLLQQALSYVLAMDVIGDVAECGCWKGHSSYIIADVLSEHEFSGEFAIFDSFEGGLSDKSSQDANSRIEMNEKQVKEEKQHFSSTERDLHKALAAFDFYKLYKGWIPDRFNEVEDKKFKFVHIDVDLYEPILASLEFFYPRIVSGGVIIIDDYSFTQFPGARKAVDAFLLENSCQMAMASICGGMFIIK